MKNQKGFILLMVAVGLIIFAVGAGAGIFYQYGKDSSNNAKSAEAVGFMKSLNSSLIPTIVVSGKVSSINGNYLTLTAKTNKVVVYVPIDTTVQSFAPATGSSKLGTQTKISFSNIKVGDTLNIGARMAENGQLQAQTILVLPVTK